MLQKLLDFDRRSSAALRVVERTPWLRTLASLVAHSGDSWYWLLVLLAAYLLGPAAWRQHIQIMSIGILFTAVLVLAIKFTVRRRRPQGEWGALYRATDPHSFPSGHAARAFMLAGLGLWLGPSWLSIALVLWAPLVMLARAALGVHYLTDVLAGALLGILVAVGMAVVLG